MKKQLDPIVPDVEAALRTNPELTATQFGIKAINDGKLVHNLRDGRQLLPSTRARVEKFLDRVAYGRF